MELYREEERMIVELHHLGQVFERGLGADDHAFFFELRDVGVVDFIAVTMTLATRRTEIRFIVTMPPPISIEQSALIGRLPS